MTRQSSTEIYKGQRQKEKRLLYRRFPFRALERLCKARFFALFGNKCFKCGAPELPPRVNCFPVLCMDHHIPMVLGGRLEPGNIVVLCRRCNAQKLDQPPEQFYTPQELAQLPAIFAQQAPLFDFAFDEEAWVQGPAAYLVSLGLDEELVEQLLHDELHPDYIGMPDPRRVAFTISMDVSSLLKDLGKDTAG